MRKTLFAVIGTILAAGSAVESRAGQNGDLDLFLQPPPTTNTAYPNVMVLLDASGSNNGSITNTCNATQKKIAMEQCIMSSMLTSGQVPNTVNMGLASYNPSTAPVNGGYIASAVRNMTATNAGTLATAINALGTVNSSYYGLLLDETYRYYRGIAPYAGTSLKSNMTAYWDPAAVTGSSGSYTYVSPVTDKCQRNYIIFIGNGGPSSNEDSNGSSPNQLASFGGNLAEISISPSNYQSSYADQWTRFLYQTDMFTSMANQQNIVTYTIGVFNPSDQTPNTLSAKALLKSMAYQGGGKYYEASSSGTMQQILHDLLLQIQSVNSSFASVALPVSVNAKGTYLNQVYIGMFRPDGSAMPRWNGNIKEYQIAFSASTGAPYYADSTGAMATTSATSAVLSNTAISFWTQSSNFWSFNPNGAGGASDSPDGPIVEKGAEAQWLRTTFATSQTGRNLYTCTGSCGSGSTLSSTPFAISNNNITQANTGTTSATDLSNLINWVRGQDLYDENINGVTTDVRASIHGDVIHSRPVVINYNRYGDDNDVFAFYGGNDGIFHAVQGGQLTSGSRAGGTEQWGFIPSEFFGQLKRLRDDNVDVMSPNPPKPSFVDGPVDVLAYDVNNNGILRPSDGDKVQLFLATHRGGRLLYSLDTTDPANPIFTWKKTNSDTGYGEMGQTWSSAHPVKIRAFANPVLVMGGGYDATAEDAMPQGTATMGRGIFVIDAYTGQVLWQAGPNPTGAATTNVTVSGMTFDIPADLMPIDRDNDGLADRLYATDTGANIWRVDMDDANPANWTVTQIASLRGANTASDKRKFLFRVDVVPGDSPGGSQPYDAVLVGSGDREHPFDTTITNRFYMIKDTNMGKSINPGFTTITEADLYDATSDILQTGTSTQIAAAQAALSAAKGWYITLGVGEKVVGNSLTTMGDTQFATNQTDTSGTSCTNLGIARTYDVSFLDGTAVYDQDGISGMSASDRSGVVQGGGLLASPVGILLTGNKSTPNPCAVSFGIKIKNCGPAQVGVRNKTYWHTNRDK